MALGVADDARGVRRGGLRCGGGAGRDHDRAGDWTSRTGVDDPPEHERGFGRTELARRRRGEGQQQGEGHHRRESQFSRSP